MKKKAQAQWPEALHLIASALDAGMSLPEALDLMKENAPEPLGTILRERTKKTIFSSHGTSHLQTLFPESELASVRAVLMLSYKTGGRAARLVKRAAQTVRKNRELEQKIDVLTIQGRWTAWIVGLSPFGFIFLLSIVMPDLMEPLFSSRMGWAFLAFITLFVSLGLLLIHRMVKVDSA